MFRHLKNLYALLAAGVVTLTFSSVAQAEYRLPSPTNRSLTGSTSLSTLFTSISTNVINIIFLIAGTLAVIYLLFSGVQYITAGGNADRVKTARQGIINAVIGIVIIMAAFFIIRIATTTRQAFDKNGNFSYQSIQLPQLG